VKQENRILLDAKAWWNGVRSMGLVDDKGELRFVHGPRGDDSALNNA
jgi:hypothetical protein